MPYIFQRGRADCGNCPLDGCTKVWGRATKKVPPIAFFGEAPGAVEEAGKPDEGLPPQPFIGPAGALFRKALHIAGIPPHTVHFGNTIACRPPGNDMESDEGIEATLRCAKGLGDELLDLVRRGTRVFVPAGNIALQTFGITDATITRARGSIYEMEIGGVSVAVIPTFHPSYILRGGEKQEVTWIGDLEKANRIAREGWSKPEEDFALYPTLADVESFLGRSRGSLIGLDTETTSLDTERAEVLMLGLASSATTALVIPFYSQGMVPYWSFDDRRAVDALLKEYLEETPVIIQNALYDMAIAEKAGWPIGRLKHDTMLMHHAIHPELSHKIGYIVAQYGSTPYWKDIVLESNDLMYNIDDETLRTYNARDSVVLHQVLRPMLEDLEEVGTERTYELSMSLIRPVREMMSNGLLLDKKKQAAWRRKTKRAMEKKIGELREGVGIHEDFSLESPDDLRWLVHKIKPRKYRTAIAELPRYDDEGTRLRKFVEVTVDEETGERIEVPTKKYEKLLRTVQAIEGTKPLIQTGGKRKTKGGQLSTKEEAMLAIQIAAANRVQAIGELVRRNAAHERELEDYDRLLRFIVLFRAYQKLSKIFSTYTNFPTKEDGRVKTHYLIHGTSTGRLSCVGENTVLQTDKGSIRIRDYDPSTGAKILTHKGNWKTITRKVYKGLDKMYRLSVHSGYSLECTEDHQLLTKTGWRRVGDLSIGMEVIDVSSKTGVVKQGTSSKDCRDVHSPLETYTPRSLSDSRGNLPDGFGDRAYEPAHRPLQSRESSAVLTLEDGGEEPNDRENRISTSSMEGGLFRPEGSSNEGSWEKAEVCSSSDNGQGNGITYRGVPPKGVRDSSHRRRWGEQRTIQSCSRNLSSASKSPRNLTKIVEKTYVGTMGVWDIEVADDHSYVAHGMLNHNSNKPNMLNIPKAARDLFIAEEGNVLIEADYDGQELRVLAEISDDDVLRQIFADGRSPHTENCKILFKIDESHKLWSVARRAAKVYIFGRNYGGSLRGIFEEVAMEVPELGLTFRQFKEADDAYRAVHPRYFEWRAAIIKEVEETRRLTNAFGRVRFFLGDFEEIKREGLNFPIQSTAADITNDAMIDLVCKLPKNARLCNYGYDSLMVESTKSGARRVCELLRECMEAPVEINGREVSFPIDIKVGTDWGNMNDLTTGAV